MEGHRDLEALTRTTLPAKELKRALRDIKGIGDYAAHTLLMLLGHYEELALDSVLRAFVSRRYFDGRAVSDREIQAVYEEWGPWKYLAYWLELD